MASSCATLFCSVIFSVIDFIDFLIPVLAGLALVLFLASMVLFIYKTGDAKHRNKERQAMGWGLVALFVLFSIWGLLRLLDESFFGVTGRPYLGGEEEPLDLRPDWAR